MTSVAAYVAAMPQTFQPDKAGSLRATFALQIQGSDGGAWTISIADQQCRVTAGAPGRAEATISMKKGEYTKLAAGQLDVQAAFQRNQVQVEGDVQLALKFTKLFTPWAGLAEAAPEPAPTAPAGSEPPIFPPGPTTADYVAAMANAFRPDRAGAAEANYQFNLSGEGGGAWSVSLAGGRVSVAKGAGTAPTVVVEMDSSQFIRMAHGRFDPMQGFQQKLISVQGDVNLAGRIADFFGNWADQTKIGAADSLAEQPTAPTPTQPQPKPSPEPDPEAQPKPSPKPQPTPGGPVTEMDRYVQAMVTGFRANKAGNFEAIYEFHLSGEGGGTWTIDVNDGVCQAYQGSIVDSATVELFMSTADFKKLAQGQFSARAAIKAKTLDVWGELKLAEKIFEIFNPWANNLNSAPPFAAPPQPFQPPAQVSSSAGMVYPHFVNGGFEYYQPYIKEGGPRFWREFPERYGACWTLQIISEGKDGAAHIMDSGAFGKFAQKYFHGNGHNYHIQGRHSQVLTGRYSYDLVLHQSIKAEPGREYEFGGSIVTFFRGPGTPRANNKIFKSVGIDPAGGRDYSAGSVVWSGRDGIDNEWRKPSIKAKAQADAITLFIRIASTEDVGETDLNTIHMDDFKLEKK